LLVGQQGYGDGKKWLAKEKESIEDNRYCGEKGQRVLTDDEGEFIESNWRLG